MRKGHAYVAMNATQLYISLYYNCLTHMHTSRRDCVTYVLSVHGTQLL